MSDRKISPEKLRRYAGAAGKPGAIEVVQHPDNQLRDFMSLLSIKRMLVIKTLPQTRSHIIDFLQNYAREHGLEYAQITVSGQTVAQDIQGEVKEVWVKGGVFSQAVHPAYWPKKKGIVVVEGINESTAGEVLEAFVSVASRGNNEIAGSFKLPEGSAFVFLAEEGFPFSTFEKFGARWATESAILQEIKGWEEFWR